MIPIADLAYLDVIVSGGQSNDKGRALKSTAPAPYLLPRTGALVWRGLAEGAVALDVGEDGESGNHYYPLVSPDDPVAQHGPEVGYIKAWEDDLDKPVVLMRYSIGGKAMLAGAGALSGTGVFDPQENQIFYAFRREFEWMARHISDTYSIGIRVAYARWCQGEADWSYLAPSNLGEYLAALNRWITEVRKMAGNPALPVIIQLPNSYDFTSSNAAGNWVRYEQIQAAIEGTNIAVVTCSVVPIYGPDLNSVTTDGTHFNSEVQILEGVRCHQIYRDMVSASPTPAPQPTNFQAVAINPTDASFTWDDVGSREYIIYETTIGVVGTTNGTSITISGLTTSTAYVFRLYTHSIGWDLKYQEISFSTP